MTPHQQARERFRLAEYREYRIGEPRRRTPMEGLVLVVVWPSCAAYRQPSWRARSRS